MRKFGTLGLIYTSYFIAVFFLSSLPFKNFFGLWSFYLNKALAVFLGALLGAHFIKIDQLVYVFFTKPEDELSLEVKSLMSQKKYGEALDRLDLKIDLQTQLASRSLLFQLAWVGLAVFALTSTVGFFSKALIMGIGLKLLLEEWEDIWQGRDINWLFWQIKRQVSFKEQKRFLYIITIVFFILSLLFL